MPAEIRRASAAGAYYVPGTPARPRRRLLFGAGLINFRNYSPGDGAAAQIRASDSSTDLYLARRACNLRKIECLPALEFHLHPAFYLRDASADQDFLQKLIIYLTQECIIRGESLWTVVQGLTCENSSKILYSSKLSPASL